MAKQINELSHGVNFFVMDGAKGPRNAGTKLLWAVEAALPVVRAILVPVYKFAAKRRGFSVLRLRQLFESNALDYTEDD